MTGEERFKKWFKTADPHGIWDADSVEHGWEGGYAQGCSDAKAMRGISADGVIHTEVFQGSPLEALEYFVQVAYDMGKKGRGM